MASADRIRELLPSLWRPEPEGADLLSALIGAAGRVLDGARVEAGDAMQAHWVRFADSALLSPHVAAFRREAGAPPLLPGAPEVAAHPYLDDLARLAALLDLSPFTEPLDGRERVEDFRARVFGTVALWKEGVGTRAAILGAARLALSGLPERAVQVEEFAPADVLSLPVATAGAPEGLVGPLMRWRVDSRAVLPTEPEIYIEGVAPVPGAVDATIDPVIELFDPATGTGRGLAYEGTVAPGQVLALLPGHASWLGGPSGALVATSLPAADGTPADPTAAGPWAAEGGMPALPVRGFAETADGTLWAAFEEAGGGGTLARLGAGGWTVALSGLPALSCLLADGMDLLLGHATGVARLAALDAVPVPLPDPAAGAGPAVAALARDAAGGFWAATSRGAARLGPDGAPTLLGPGGRPETETALLAVEAGIGGELHFGGAAGLFRLDPASGRWHVFRGGATDETVPDWIPWDPGAHALPGDAAVFLPEVTALLRGPDAVLWIGTAAGLARYRARSLRASYATRLEAFPELGTGRVHCLAVDERQRLWAGTERGLLVHDGLDWFQAQGGVLVRLPRLPARPPDLDWRFDRGAGVWQSARAGAAAGFQAQTPAPITAAEPAVTAIRWSDTVVARLGTMGADGAFATDPGAATGPLRARLKPAPDRILDGARPVLPRLPPGRSDWRYLSLEEAVPPVPRSFPAWTREGRLLPPPDAAAAPAEGRYLAAAALAERDQVFAYDPAARVSVRWRPRAALSVTVRLARQSPEEMLPAPVLDRIHAALQTVRPAGARVRLAHGEAVVRGGGGSHG